MSNFAEGTILITEQIGRVRRSRVERVALDAKPTRRGITLRHEDGRREFRAVVDGASLPIERLVFGYRPATPEEAQGFPAFDAPV